MKFSGDEPSVHTASFPASLCQHVKICCVTVHDQLNREKSLGPLIIQIPIEIICSALTTSQSNRDSQTGLWAAKPVAKGGLWACAFVYSLYPTPDHNHKLVLLRSRTNIQATCIIIIMNVDEFQNSCS